MDTLNPVPDEHLPDPPPPQARTRHPMMATGGIMVGVVTVCLLLAWISML